MGAAAPRRECAANSERSEEFPQGGLCPSEDFNEAGSPRGLAAWGSMLGLPKVPAAEKIDVDCEGKITGLF